MTFGHRNDVASAELGEMDGFGRAGGCAHHRCHLSHPVLPSDVTQLPTDVHIYSPLFTPYSPPIHPYSPLVVYALVGRVQGGCKEGVRPGHPPCTLLAPSYGARARALY